MEAEELNDILMGKKKWTKDREQTSDTLRWILKERKSRKQRMNEVWVLKLWAELLIGGGKIPGTWRKITGTKTSWSSTSSNVRGSGWIKARGVKEDTTAKNDSMSLWKENKKTPSEQLWAPVAHLQERPGVLLMVDLGMPLKWSHRWAVSRCVHEIPKLR